MPELKKIRVREAKARDIGLFKKLWSNLLEKQAAEGSLAVASDKTLALYEGLFNAYIEGDFDGIVLFVADKGVLMWGDSGSPVEHAERIVTAWGHYIEYEEPEAIERALLSHAERWAVGRGFKGITTIVYPKSECPDEFYEIGRIVYRTLDA